MLALHYQALKAYTVEYWSGKIVKLTSNDSRQAQAPLGTISTLFTSSIGLLTSSRANDYTCCTVVMPLLDCIRVVRTRDKAEPRRRCANIETEASGSLVKCGIEECGMRKVKCGIENCGNGCRIVGTMRNAEKPTDNSISTMLYV